MARKWFCLKNLARDLLFYRKIAQSGSAYKRHPYSDVPKASPWNLHRDCVFITSAKFLLASKLLTPYKNSVKTHTYSYKIERENKNFLRWGNNCSHMALTLQPPSPNNLPKLIVIRMRKSRVLLSVVACAADILTWTNFVFKMRSQPTNRTNRPFHFQGWRVQTTLVESGHKMLLWLLLFCIG